ncbi:hypothetical protein H0H92_003717 [Tricholoma furcatifolium]|nr:hypothetical protein H0H92_003717 [Tricholoma furcatifolium]
MSSEDSSIVDKLDSAVPAPLAQFDAFPKIPSAYKSRSESRGFMTVFVALLALLLMLNDVADFIWGWPDQEFSIDHNKSPFMNINIDVVVAMHCKYLSVDLRDAVGDRLMLTGNVRRDGVVFDTNQASKFVAHSDGLSVHEAVSQSRKSRGIFAWLRRKRDNSQPTYDHVPSSHACRVSGSLAVKRTTANLHITTMGHGYASYEHAPHDQVNLSHIIKEFSFGPYFPDIVQPLDYSFEVTHDPFVAYQYFLHVVPTTYIAPRSEPLETNQYSVTHYSRVLEHNRGTPGIFFKFDLDPLSITIHQRTPSFIQLVIRCVGVIGGIFVCMGYAIKITTRAVEVVSGADSSPGLVAAESTGVKVGLRQKWGGSELRARPGKMIRQGSGWVMEGSDSPYAASYSGTPTSNGFPSAATSGPPASAFVTSPGFAVPSTPPHSAVGGFQSPSAFGRPSAGVNGHTRTQSLVGATWTPAPRTPLSSQQAVPPAGPPTPGGYATYPQSPAANGNGVSVGPPPKRAPNGAKKDD